MAGPQSVDRQPGAKSAQPEEIAMTRLISLKTANLALVLMSAVLVTPAFATSFYGSATGHWAGSYANPRPQDLRGVRNYPVVSQSQNATGKVGRKSRLTQEG